MPDKVPSYNSIAIATLEMLTGMVINMSLFLRPLVNMMTCCEKHGISNGVSSFTKTGFRGKWHL